MLMNFDMLMQFNNFGNYILHKYFLKFNILIFCISYEINTFVVLISTALDLRNSILRARDFDFDIGPPASVVTKCPIHSLRVLSRDRKLRFIANFFSAFRTTNDIFYVNGVPLLFHLIHI